MFKNSSLVSECAIYAGIPVERLYKSKRIEKQLFGKKLVTPISDSTGDIFFDSIKLLTTSLSNLTPFSEFIIQQSLSRRQEDDLRRSTYVQDFSGVLVFFTPGQIVDEIKDPIIVCEDTAQEIDHESGYKICVKISDSLYICAY